MIEIFRIFGTLDNFLSRIRGNIAIITTGGSLPFHLDEVSFVIKGTAGLEPINSRIKFALIINNLIGNCRFNFSDSFSGNRYSR
jgi:hypothetical protein